MNNKGFSLITVIILSLVIFLIGGTGLYIASNSFKATRADMNFNIAEKAANAGLMAAFDQINMAGAGGDDRTISGTLGNASYLTNINYGGKNLWFLNSEGRVGTIIKAKVTKTALFQGYYGVGLYTVRGNVNANLSGARLSGCDASSAPACYVPAFVASGRIDTGRTTPQACTDNNGDPMTSAVNGTSVGVYGSPGTLNMNLGDLSRIFFKVKCFNKYNSLNCSTSLLDFLEYDYGWNTARTEQYMSFQQADANANGNGIPVVSIPAPESGNASGVSSSCIFPVSGNMFNRTLNLASDLTNCGEIAFNSALTTVTILGDGTRNGQRVKIYTNGINNHPTFRAASNFIFYADRPFSVQGSSNNFKVNSTAEGTFISSSDFEVHSTAHNYLDRPSRFNLYTTGTTRLAGTIAGTTANPFRIISTNTVTVDDGGSLTDGTVVQGPASVADVNSSAAPQNLMAKGAITVDNVNIFTRRFGFAGNSTIRILNSLVYVYAYACPACPRNTSTSSRDACESDTNWCGYDVGGNTSLSIGRDQNGSEMPVLFISNNTTVKANISGGTEYIWGVWYGEDVTYLGWPGTDKINIRGFLIRNFPPALTLNIELNGRFTYNYSKSMIDAITSKYRFFREVECVRDPLTPKAQLIQTRMTSY